MGVQQGKFLFPCPVPWEGGKIGWHSPCQPYWGATRGPSLLWDLVTGLGTQADCHRHHLWKEDLMGRFVLGFFLLTPKLTSALTK